MLSVEKHRHEADITLLAGGLKIHGSETTGDLFSSLDLVTDKLEKQIRALQGQTEKHKAGPPHAR